MEGHGDVLEADALLDMLVAPHELADSSTRQLRRDLLVGLRTTHQTDFTVRAVRQALRPCLVVNGSHYSMIRPSALASQEPSLREALLHHLSSLLPSDEKPGASNSSSTGVNRSVHHTGTFTAADTAVTSTRLEQKQVLAESSATVRQHILPSSYYILIMFYRNLCSVAPVHSSHC